VKILRFSPNDGLYFVRNSQRKNTGVNMKFEPIIKNFMLISFD